MAKPRSAAQRAAQKKASLASAAKRKAKASVPKPLKGGRAKINSDGTFGNQYGQKITQKQYLALHKIDSQEAGTAALMRSLNRK